MIDREPIDRELLLKDIRECLSDPVREERQLDGSIVMVGGDPGEVVIRVSGSKVSVSVFSVRWEGPHSPMVRPIRFATLRWKQIPPPTLMMTLHILIKAAHEVRTAKYRKCERCGKTNPPEWIHDEKTCQACAERHLGVVY
jgi:hypothetical protein